MLNQLSSTSCVWTCGSAEKSLFVASTLKIIIITVCLFTWQIYEKRREATYLTSICVWYWLLVSHLRNWCPSVVTLHKCYWQCLLESCSPRIGPVYCLRSLLSLITTYRSKQGSNVLCLSSLTYYRDAFTCCYTYLGYLHKARVLLNQHIVSRQD